MPDESIRRAIGRKRGLAEICAFAVTVPGSLPWLRQVVMVAFGLVGQGLAQDPGRPLEPHVIERASTLGNPSAVIGLLEPWIANTIGDQRLGQATRMVESAYVDLANRFRAEAIPRAVFRTLVRHARFLEAIDIDQSVTLLRNASEYARSTAKAGDASVEELLALQQDFSAAFPDEPVLLTPDDLARLGVDRLRVQNQSTTHLAYEVMRLLFGHIRSRLVESDLTEMRQILAKHYKDLAVKGWYAESLTLNALVDKNVKTVTEQVGALTRALGQLEYDGFGRRVALAPWIEALASSFPEPVAQLRQQMNPGMAELGTPFTAGAAQPIVADVTWADPGEGLSVQGIVQVGTGKWPDDKTARGSLRIKGSAHVSNGCIRVHEGELRFEGEPRKPIVVQDVTIELLGHGGATVSASHTLFRNCRFVRHTGWNNVPARWTFDNCLFFGCVLPSLDRAMARLRVDNSAFVACSIPPIRPREKEQSGARLRDGKDAFQRVDFWRCAVAPSVTLHAIESNFIECTADSDVFRADHDVTARVYSSSRRFERELLMQVQEVAAGRFRTAFVKDPFKRKSGWLKELWLLAPPLDWERSPR